jgi:hypothetical protein
VYIHRRFPLPSRFPLWRCYLAIQNYWKRVKYMLAAPLNLHGTIKTIVASIVSFATHRVMNKLRDAY